MSFGYVHMWSVSFVLVVDARNCTTVDFRLQGVPSVLPSPSRDRRHFGLRPSRFLPLFFPEVSSPSVMANLLAVSMKDLLQGTVVSQEAVRSIGEPLLDFFETAVKRLLADVYGYAKQLTKEQVENLSVANLPESNLPVLICVAKLVKEMSGTHTAP